MEKPTIGLWRHRDAGFVANAGDRAQFSLNYPHALYVTFEPALLTTSYG